MKILSVLTILALSTPIMANSAEDHGMLEVCKAYCPNAKTEDEAEKCAEGLAKSKKDDKKFRKSDCFSVFKEHQKHEGEHGHSH